MKYETHHISKRKRVHQRLEDYPSKRKFIRALDKFLVLIAAIAPISTIPQIIKLYSTQQAGDLALFSWAIWTILDIPWIVYGAVHKEKPILIAYLLWFIMNFSIVIGILLYS